MLEIAPIFLHKLLFGPGTFLGGGGGGVGWGGIFYRLWDGVLFPI